MSREHFVFPLVIYDESGVPVASIMRSFPSRPAAIQAAIKELNIDYDEAAEAVVRIVN